MVSTATTAERVMVPANLWTRMLASALWEWFSGEPVPAEKTSAIRQALASLTLTYLDAVARDFLSVGAEHAYPPDDLAVFWYSFDLPRSDAMPRPRRSARGD